LNITGDMLKDYELNNFQQKMISDIKSLPRKKLHYITAQQSNSYPNLTLPELKKFIKQGIRRYIRQIEPLCSKEQEKALVKFYCVFETTKEFDLNIKNASLNEIPFMGLHFHLFISCPDNYSWICFDALIYQIFFELTSLKHKKKCISKYGYYKLDNLNDNFLTYHTKQFQQHPSNELILYNLK
jgi:hypothetical protein